MEDKGIFGRVKEIQGVFNELDGKEKSLNDYSIGDTISLTFEAIILKLRKVGMSLYEVVDSGDSQKVKEGDVLKVKDPNSKLEMGEKIEFIILRPALEYRTDIVLGIE